MSVSIQIVDSPDLQASFVDFYDTAYEWRAVRWPGKKLLEYSILGGESPLIAGRPFRAFLALDDGKVVARAIALVDTNYLRHWNDKVGHFIMFEALDGSDAAVKLLADEAGKFLATHGLEAMRAGYGLLDTPFPIDEYELLPPINVRQSPAYYHRLLKNAGFQTEKGWVDYKMRVTDARIEEWKAARAGTLSAGYELVRFADIEENKLVRDLTYIRNETFKLHWATPLESEDEVRFLLRVYQPLGGMETSLLAYKDSKVVGMALAMPEVAATAIVRPPRVLDDSEKLNTLLFGVAVSERHTGLQYGLGASVYLDLAARGAKYMDGTLVLDDNWPSRHSAEFAGLSVWASYVTYRRNFG